MSTRRDFVKQTVGAGLAVAVTGPVIRHAAASASAQPSIQLAANDQAAVLLNNALRIIDDAWNELQRDLYVQLRMGATPTRLPDLSFAEAERRSSVGRSLIERIGALDLDALPHDLALTLRLVRFRAQAWSREAEWYWTVVQPYGRAGFFGMFLPTTYCGGYLLQLVHDQLGSFPFREPGDIDGYLALLSDYARIVEQFAVRTAGQAERGMRMPQPQVLRARTLLAALKSGASAALRVAPERLTAVSIRGFPDEIDRRIATSIAPAFDRATSVLSVDYLAKAPERVGIGQYVDGANTYAELVKMHTTLNVAAEDVHARGLARMAEIEESTRKITADLGYKNDRDSFLAHLAQDPRWRASNVAEVTAVFRRCLDRIEPQLGAYFASLPKAPYQLRPLPEALQKGMTFGTYDPPRGNRPEGIFRFNAAHLISQPLIHVPALIFHELMPGHHLQRVTQLENESLHPFRKFNFINAYDEGWAEYAASIFADEIGLYEQPEERYGRLMFDAFTTSRLVVDTGMNALGWSLERARDYMRTHSGRTEAEINSELMRYSCDLPGQALPYKLCDTHLLKVREQMRRALGTRFRLKDFHAAVLGPGALPMPELDWHVDHEIDRFNAGSGVRRTP